MSDEPWKFFDYTVRATSQEKLVKLIRNMCLEMTLLKLLPGPRPTKDKCHDILQISWH